MVRDRVRNRFSFWLVIGFAHVFMLLYPLSSSLSTRHQSFAWLKIRPGQAQSLKRVPAMQS